MHTLMKEVQNTVSQLMTTMNELVLGCQGSFRSALTTAPSAHLRDTGERCANRCEHQGVLKCYMQAEIKRIQSLAENVDL